MQFCRGTSGVLGLTLLVATNGLGDDPDHVLILRLEVYVCTMTSSRKHSDPYKNWHVIMLALIISDQSAPR